LPEESYLTTPLRKENISKLRVRNIVFLNGTVYTARDMAHIRIMDFLRENKQLPVDFEGTAVFHAGPVMEKNGGEWRIKVIGPTTSMRMEPFSETILGKLGAKAIIGKGGMGKGTQQALEKYCGVYLLSPPGCSVVQAKAVEKVLRVHWIDLGVPEAIWVLEVKMFGPLIVAMDSNGNNIFDEVKERALNKVKSLLG